MVGGWGSTVGGSFAQPHEQPRDRRWMPRCSTRREDASAVQFLGDGPEGSDPLGLDVVQHCLEIGGTLLCFRSDLRYSLSIADLLALQGAGAVRIAQAYPTGLCGCQGHFRAFADQAGL